MVSHTFISLSIKDKRTWWSKNINRVDAAFVFLYCASWSLWVMNLIVVTYILRLRMWFNTSLSVVLFFMFMSTVYFVYEFLLRISRFDEVRRVRRLLKVCVERKDVPHMPRQM
jgi:hypothetical protein